MIRLLGLPVHIFQLRDLQIGSMYGACEPRTRDASRISSDMKALTWEGMP